jgi:hypothetical protein
MTGMLAAMNTPTGTNGQITFEEEGRALQPWLMVLGVHTPRHCSGDEGPGLESIAIGHVPRGQVSEGRWRVAGESWRAGVGRGKLDGSR